MTSIYNHAAYQGRGWRPRKKVLAAELAHQLFGWSAAGANSEWGRLQRVCLFIPPARLKWNKSAQEVQHLKPVKVKNLRAEMLRLRRIYNRLGVQVTPILIAKDLASNRRNVANRGENLVFARDLFLATPEGAIIARMASQVRAGEEKYLLRTMANNNFFVRGAVGGGGLFEGADALWLNPREVLVGVGQRTNRLGFQQIQNFLRMQGVKCIPVTVPRGVQHLLGFIQIVGPRHVLLRKSKISASLINLFRRRHFEVGLLEDTFEITHKQAFNFVTLRQGQVLLASDCPHTEEQLQKHGLNILAHAPIPQLIRAAGGIACASGILQRELVLD